MGVPQAMEALRERAAFIRDSLHKSQTSTENMVAILGSFDHRLSALETAMRPTQVPLLFQFHCLVPEKLKRETTEKENNIHCKRKENDREKA